jgi:multiple sugar transport system substrate-binding protein
MALSALTACGGGDDGSSADGKVTLNLTWWGDDTRAERYNQAVALFEEQNPDIDVKTNFTDWEAYWTGRSTEAAGRALPDVMQFDLSYLREYAENGHLLDLSEHVGAAIDTAGMDEKLVASGEVDGKQLALPVGSNTLALFVNTLAATQAGADPLPEDYTWEDYNAWVEKVSAANIKSEGGQKIYGGADYTGTMWFFMSWLKQQGIEPFAEDGSFNFGEAEVTEYLGLTADLREGKALLPAERDVQLDPLDGFAAGEQATSFTWDNFLAGYDAEVGEGIEMMPIPTGDNGEKSMFWKPSMMLAAGANTEHPEEAAELIDFLLTEPEVGKIFGTSQGVRADEAQREAVAPEAGSVDAKVTDFEATVAPHVTETVPLPVKGFGTIEAAWLRLSQDLSYGAITVDEFAEQWFAEAETATE